MTAARTLLAASLLALAAAASAPTWAQSQPAAPSKPPAAAKASPAPAQRSQQQDRGGQQAFEQGKAVGQAAATTTQTDLSTGRAQEVVRSTIQGYTADPPARASYAAQTGASEGAQMRAACAAGQAGTDAATCDAIEVGGRPRDLSGTRPNDPALAGQAAVSRPERVLGDIARTYNACSVGGSLSQPPDWQAASCQLGSNDWSEHVCTKSLSLRPVQTQTCAEGAVIAGGAGASPGSTDITTGRTTPSWTVRLAGYCSLPTGAKPMRFVAEGDASCGEAGEPVKHDLDLYTLPGANELPRELSPVVVRKSDGMCSSIPTYVLGPGCIGNACRVEVHFSPTGYERINRCLVGVIGTSISFTNWAMSKAQANGVCLTPFPSRRIAEIVFGVGVAGDTGVQIGVGVPQFWVPIAGSVFDHVEWPQDHVGFDMAFTLPRVFPPSGDLWSSGCAALEARTRALPPDGTRVSLPLVPMLGDSSAQQCLLKSSTCLDGPSDKLIDGQRVSRACWTWRNTFACTTPVAAANCPAARDPSCAPSGQPQCLQEDGLGRCLQARADFACKTSRRQLHRRHSTAERRPSAPTARAGTLRTPRAGTTRTTRWPWRSSRRAPKPPRTSSSSR